MTDITVQMQRWQQWLEEHRDDPVVTAGWAKVGRLLGGGR